MAHQNRSRSIRRHNTIRYNSRYFDVPTEIDNNLNPIEGYESKPLQSLSKTITYIEHLVPDVKIHARKAESGCKSPCPDGLSLDQSAAIRLYTMEWEPEQKCLYAVLNQTLRNKDRNKLKPWFAYLKLILTGLFQLESSSITVYRGVKLDLRREYREGNLITWWSFSSCTDDLKILESEKFLGQTGARTIFIIKSFTGKSIQQHSYFPGEGEVLLLPATQFIVEASICLSPDLSMIDLREVPSPNPLLELPYSTIDTATNSALESLLVSVSKDKMDLSEKSLSDRDVMILCKNLKSNTTCISLDLSVNNITLDGAVHISNALRFNKTLKSLNIGYNQLTDFGITTLVHGLHCNKTLENITLSANQVTDNGVESLVNMLFQNATIIYLDISSNQISDIGLQRFIDLLSKGNQLQQLFLNNNSITDKSTEAVIHMLKVNRSLVSLYLHGNQFSDDSKESIRSATIIQNGFALSL